MTVSPVLTRFCFFLQDEKNQVLTTYIWYRQVSRRNPGASLFPCWVPTPLNMQVFLQERCAAGWDPSPGVARSLQGRDFHALSFTLWGGAMAAR